MPIHTKIPVQRISQARFHEINEKVMAAAFHIHNELGRFCNEKIYQNALLEACRSDGFPLSRKEVEIQVVHRDFRKSYFIDLLIEQGIIYETKTAEGFTEAHRRQVLHYLMLVDLLHGILLNFRSRSVQHEFVSTRLTAERRTFFTVHDMGWQAPDARSKELKNLFLELLLDWGAFLDSSLYTEALTHFLGGEEAVIAPAEILFGNKVVGHQKVHLLDAETAFKITAATKNINYYKKDLLRFLAHTNLESIQWINLNHHNIEFCTLKK
jgi:GxxExxY protein